MKAIFLSLVATFCLNSSFASELKILSWMRVDDNGSNSTAELCVSLRPAPQKPTYIEVTVDKKTRWEGYSSFWIDQRGSACHLVSSQYGRVEVKVGSKLRAKASF